MDPKRELLRHLVAALAYRSARALGGAPAGFADFRTCDTAMSCGEVLRHMANVMDWTCRLAAGEERGAYPDDVDWARDRGRFYTMLQKFDDFLVTDREPAVAVEQLLHGPLSDCLTHVGQLAMLRRMAGAPMAGVSYYAADIRAGNIGEARAMAEAGPSADG